MRLPKAVIITAIPEELEAIREFVNCTDETDEEDRSVYFRGLHQSPTPRAGCAEAWDIYLTMPIGAGNPLSAAATVRVASRLKPDVILFVGIAGGIPSKVNLYDVVVPDKIFYYEPGAVEAQALLPRAEQARPARMLLERAKAEAGLRRWTEFLRPLAPNEELIARVQPIAAGELLLRRSDGEHMTHIRAVAPRSVAVEQEGFGVLMAAHDEDIAAVVVRGISDLMDDKASSAEGGYVPQYNSTQLKAARHAAAFALAMLENLDVTWMDGVRHAPGRGKRLVRFHIEGQYDASDPEQTRILFEAVQGLHKADLVENFEATKASILLRFDADEGDIALVRAAVEGGLLKSLASFPIISVDSDAVTPPDVARLVQALEEVQIDRTGWQERLRRVEAAAAESPRHRQTVLGLCSEARRTALAERQPIASASGGRRPAQVVPAILDSLRADKQKYLEQNRELMDRLLFEEVPESLFEELSTRSDSRYFFVDVPRDIVVMRSRELTRQLQAIMAESFESPSIPSRDDIEALINREPFTLFKAVRLHAALTAPELRRSGVESVLSSAGLSDGFAEKSIIPALHVFDGAKFDTFYKAARGGSISELAEIIRRDNYENNPRLETALRRLREGYEWRGGQRRGWFRITTRFAEKIYKALEAQGRHLPPLEDLFSTSLEEYPIGTRLGTRPLGRSDGAII